MKKNMNIIGIIILIGLFIIFYIFADFFLSKSEIKDKQTIDTDTEIKNEEYNKEIAIINNLYSDIRILYDVVNNKFKVSQEDTIIIGDITYKKVTNFNEIMDNLFTTNGQDKYLKDLGNYFAITEDGIYLAGNLVTYQTYYFRGDTTKIFITSSTDTEINGIIYEKWTSNNKNTIATIKLINTNNKWLVEDITILATE